MTVYVANMSDRPQQAVISVDNFHMKSKTDAYIIGDCELTEYNTYHNQDNVVFKKVQVRISGKNIKHVFPKYSYTVITIKTKASQ